MADLTAAQAAAELQVKPATVAAYCHRGDIPGAYLIGRRWRIPPTALDAIKTPAPTLLAPRSRRSAAQQRRTA